MKKGSSHNANISGSELAMANSLHAVRVLEEIMRDEKVEANHRIKAASTLWKFAHEAYLELEQNPE